ncbi:MAG: molybdate ABC transporter substrate-binding protein [Desulfuromonadales bacterium]|nr:molybdate ABC transporter substrate-binding protein [Desulfuromonadales bacterium]
MIRVLIWLSLAMVTACPAFAGDKPRPLMVFAGSASQPPLEEAAKAFEKKTGIPVTLQLGGSGAMLSQIRLAGRGDLYIPGSPDYLELAREQRLVEGEATILAYLVPAIIVAKGNPLEIKTLTDLIRPGLKVGMADPDGVCVGLYAVEVLTANGIAAKVKPNLRGQVESCARAASMIPLGMADAVLGWREFAAWNPATMETVLLRPEQVPRLAYIPAVTIRGCGNPAGAAAFTAFLTSAEGEAIFRKWGYLTREADVRPLAPQARIGGSYRLPEGWR